MRKKKGRERTDGYTNNTESEKRKREERRTRRDMRRKGKGDLLVP